eukprot:CAMPEP_0179107424 /NCGR_PEP_ID=MMETSP0796-20121207/49997_1 /TAXON_ID=73915 /ORGANISM="Pyrodinium bahamense, Strain pbaha01" /LENGTH=152 /DNA_ID=CAMNT_0020805483 /DNA_START=20 /DNA_END=474 /DNA_ORIENTATION=+
MGLIHNRLPSAGHLVLRDPAPQESGTQHRHLVPCLAVALLSSLELRAQLLQERGPQARRLRGRKAQHLRQALFRLLDELAKLRCALLLAPAPHCGGVRGEAGFCQRRVQQQALELHTTVLQLQRLQAARRPAGGTEVPGSNGGGGAVTAAPA